MRSEHLARGVVVAVAVLLAPAASAEAKKLDCGDVITKDTVLSNNLNNCPVDGIVIGDDGVTLDLNGKTVDWDRGRHRHCGQQPHRREGRITEPSSSSRTASGSRTAPTTGS